MDPVSDPDLHAAALALLRTLVADPDATFHEHQFEAIEALVAHRQRVLVVQRTGWGKSAVYFVATGLLRARGAGPTVIVSPLLALMRDQIQAAARSGVRAMTINSANPQEWAEVAAALREDTVDVLLVSPERLANPRFRDEALPALLGRIGMLVVDEAHCISDWGHDFRPDYRRIRDLLTAVSADTPVLATTATANSRVVADVREQLHAGATADVPVIRGPLARASLRLGVVEMPSSTERIAWLAAHLDDLDGSGIVYTLTVSAADDLAELLRAAGHRVSAYTGRTDPEERERLEAALKANEVKALIATSALGMGFDKPDLGFVVHLGAPSSPIAYYQQVGRAGRATASADVLLLPGHEDADIWAYFATASMPARAEAATVLRVLGEGGARSTVALETMVDVRRTRLELLLKVLAADGAVRRVSGGWESTGAGWEYDEERYARVAAARVAEQEAMRGYIATTSCRMAFLQRSLDDDTATDCGRCDRCAGPWVDPSVPEAARERAAEALRSVGVPLEPRLRWPTGMSRLGVPVSGAIAADRAVAMGRCVARLTDLGWGQSLRGILSGPDGPASEELLRACVGVLREWDWADRPVAIAAVPSRQRPELVQSVATGLARLGRLDDLGSLDLVDGGPTGEAGGNSAHRLAGVWGRFALSAAMAQRVADLDGPVLLVDDLADSRWTVTVTGELLRSAGAPAVLPLALARAA